jgi:hypothetical protein
MTDRPTPETDAEVTSYFEKKHPPIVCYHELAKFAHGLERERDEARDDTRVLLKEIFNLTQIGDPHPADLPIKALQAIAEMIDEHLKEARK